eukprot:jgi/Pico_ML_1/51625/g2619.t1
MRESARHAEGREDGVKEIDFQAPLQIVKYPDPRLRAKNMRIDEFGDSLRDFAKEMLVAMVEYDGIGLAAPQGPHHAAEKSTTTCETGHNDTQPSASWLDALLLRLSIGDSIV